MTTGSRTHRAASPRFATRLGWFVLLWLGGVASVALVAALLRLVAT